MVKESRPQLAREDWLQAALELCVAGIDQVKVAPLASDLGVTTGSFYWHFKNRRELLEALLEYWEREMTDKAIETARHYAGSPAERIFFIMDTVMSNSLARYDLAIWQWAQSDVRAGDAFNRVLEKRFSFAKRMFSEVGFSSKQAEVRGRMMVVYMMGESTLIPDPIEKRRQLLKLKHKILIAPEQ